MIYLLIVWFAIYLYKQFPSKSVKASFKRKLQAGKYGYANLEFENYMAKDRRESLRKEFDRLNDTVDAYQMQIDNKKNTKETIKKFEDSIEGVKKSRDEMKERLEDADRGIELAVNTLEDLHHQEKLMREFVKNL